MSRPVLTNDGVVRTETAAYPWHGEGAAPYPGELTKQYTGNTRYEQTRAGGRVGVADWESVSVVSDLDKSLKQDATEMHGLNSKCARVYAFDFAHSPSPAPVTLFAPTAGWPATSDSPRHWSRVTR